MIRGVLPSGSNTTNYDGETTETDLNKKPIETFVKRDSRAESIMRKAKLMAKKQKDFKCYTKAELPDQY